MLGGPQSRSERSGGGQIHAAAGNKTFVIQPITSDFNDRGICSHATHLHVGFEVKV